MTDKQKLALKELADVMERHGITIDSDTDMVVWVGSDDLAPPWRDGVNAYDIREELKA